MDCALYDTFTASGAVTTYFFFLHQLGLYGKTLEETNLRAPAVFTGEESLAVQALELKCLDVLNPEDFQKLLTAVATFVVNDIPVPDPVPVGMILVGAVSVGDDPVAIGIPPLEFNPPLVHLDPGDSFRIILDFPTGAQEFSKPLRLQCNIYGEEVDAATRTRAFGSRSKGQKTIYCGWLYDQVILHEDNLSSESYFFTVSRGQAGKTARETNLQVPAAFTGVNAFRAESISMRIPMTYTVEDFELIRDCQFTFYKNGKEVIGPISIEHLLYVPIIDGGIRLHGTTMVPIETEVILDPGDMFEGRLSNPRKESIKDQFPHTELDLFVFGTRAKPSTA